MVSLVELLLTYLLFAYRGHSLFLTGMNLPLQRETFTFRSVKFLPVTIKAPACLGGKQFTNLYLTQVSAPPPKKNSNEG